MNIFIGFIGDKIAKDRFNINSIVYMELKSKSVSFIDIREFFNSDISILSLDKEFIANNLDINSSRDFIYSNEEANKFLCKENKHIEFNFNMPVFASYRLNWLLNYSNCGDDFINIFICLSDIPYVWLHIDLRRFEVFLDIHNYCVFRNKRFENNSFNYGIYEDDAKDLWKELCKAFYIETGKGFCSINKCIFINVVNCDLVTLSEDTRYLSICGRLGLLTQVKVKNNAKVVINPSIEEINLSLFHPKNSVKLYISSNISIDVLKSILSSRGHPTVDCPSDKTTALHYLKNEIEHHLGVNMYFY